MKRKYSYFDGKKQTEREYSYIPFRYILAVFIALLEVLAVIGIVTALCYYVPYFYLAAWATEFFCVIRIIASDDNPDYKVPWLLFVLIIPIAGFMLYFMFYSRMLKNIADTHIFTDTKQEYFPLGEDMHIPDLQ